MSNLRVGASAETAVSVTPSDTDNISHPTGETFTKGLYVGSAGNLNVVMANGDAITFTSVAAGSLLPLSVKRVNSASTTAANIIAVY